MVQVVRLHADGTKALEFQTMGGVESAGTVPIDIGVDVKGVVIVFVGKYQVNPTVSIEVLVGRGCRV